MRGATSPTPSTCPAASESAMGAGAEHFGGLARDLTAAMEGYTGEELAVVRRWLEDMTAVITRHNRDSDSPAP
ncbi:hypothetical protein [Blastococcus atacamensis]|uniref:hypothetical protein n=1 Tax=Blastococcus atacamensis TaxID=2070508 RepID=UPI0012FFF3B9|nr:hypothetical protein [Blastococcus atacamensis]